MNARRVVGTICAVVLLAGACGGNEDDEPSPTEEAQATCPQEASSPGPGHVAGEHYFEQEKPWELDPPDIDIVDGCFRMRVNNTDTHLYNTAALADLGLKSSGGGAGTLTGLQNLAVEVDAQRIAGPEESYQGVICAVAPDILYGLSIGNNQGAVIARIDQNRVTVLGSIDEVQDAIDPEGPNHIRGECDTTSSAPGWSGEFRLSVNGEQLLVATDTLPDAEFDSFGGVGVEAVTTQEAGLEVGFDYFRVLDTSAG